MRTWVENRLKLWIVLSCCNKSQTSSGPLSISPPDPKHFQPRKPQHASASSQHQPNATRCMSSNQLREELMRFHTCIRSDAFNLTCTERAELMVTLLRGKMSYSYCVLYVRLGQEDVSWLANFFLFLFLLLFSLNACLISDPAWLIQ